MVVDSSSSEEEEVPTKKQKNYTIDDIMTLDKSLQITKKQKQSDAAASVPAAVQKKSKNIKKVKHAKKSQKIVRFWSRFICFLSLIKYLSFNSLYDFICNSILFL